MAGYGAVDPEAAPPINQRSIENFDFPHRHTSGNEGLTPKAASPSSSASQWA